MSENWIQFLPFAVWTVISVIPSIRLLRRAGIHPAIAAVNLIPFAGAVIVLWIVAYSKWPKVPETAGQGSS